MEGWDAETIRLILPHHLYGISGTVQDADKMEYKCRNIESSRLVPNRIAQRT